MCLRAHRSQRSAPIHHTFTERLIALVRARIHSICSFHLYIIRVNLDYWGYHLENPPIKLRKVLTTKKKSIFLKKYKGTGKDAEFFSCQKCSPVGGFPQEGRFSSMKLQYIAYDWKMRFLHTLPSKKKQLTSCQKKTINFHTLRITPKLVYKEFGTRWTWIST